MTMENGEQAVEALENGNASVGSDGSGSSSTCAFNVFYQMLNMSSFAMRCCVHA